MEDTEKKLEIRYNDYQREKGRADKLQAELDGWEGMVLEPLQERYKYVCEENAALRTENERQAKKLQIIQLEIDHILGTKTPTELRIEQALKGFDEQGS